MKLKGCHRCWYKVGRGEGKGWLKPLKLFWKSTSPSPTFQCREYFKVQHKLAIINTSTVKYTMYVHEALRLPVPPEAKVKNLPFIFQNRENFFQFSLYVSSSHCWRNLYISFKLACMWFPDFSHFNSVWHNHCATLHINVFPSQNHNIFPSRSRSTRCCLYLFCETHDILISTNWDDYMTTNHI